MELGIADFWLVQPQLRGCAVRILHLMGLSKRHSRWGRSFGPNPSWRRSSSRVGGAQAAAGSARKGARPAHLPVAEVVKVAKLPILSELLGERCNAIRGFRSAWSNFLSQTLRLHSWEDPGSRWGNIHYHHYFSKGLSLTFLIQYYRVWAAPKLYISCEDFHWRNLVNQITTLKS